MNGLEYLLFEEECESIFIFYFRRESTGEGRQERDFQNSYVEGQFSSCLLRFECLYKDHLMKLITLDGQKKILLDIVCLTEPVG